MFLPLQLKNKINQYDPRVWYLFVTRVFNALGFSIVLPFLSIHLYLEMHISMSLIGSIFLVSATARAVSQYLGGEISDRWGRRNVLIVGALGRVAIFAFLGCVVFYNWGFLLLGLGIVLSYIFGGMFFTAADTLIADIVSSKDRVEVYAIQRVAIHLGWTIGPAAAGLLSMLPFYSLFFITSAIFIIPVILVLIYIKESLTITKAQSQFRLSLKFKEMKKFLLFCVFILLTFSVMTQIISTFAVFSVDQIGISKAQLAFLFSLNGVLIVIFQFHATKVIRKMALTFALFIGASFMGIGFLLVPFATGIWTLVLAICLITFGELFITPSGAAMVSRWAPENERGRYFGIYGLFMAFGRSIGPFYGGILMDNLMTQRFILWGSIAGVTLLAGMGFQFVGRSIPKTINNE